MEYIIGVALLFAVGYSVFRRYNMGLARNSQRQQFRRYLIGAALSVAMVAIARRSFGEAQVIMAAVTSLLWIFTYNVLYDKTYRASSPDYDNHIDIAFGIYLFGWLVGVGSLLCWFSTVIGSIALAAVEAMLVFLPVFQIGYYMIYGVCIDNSGMQVLLETNGNEELEFAKSFHPIKLMAMIASVLFCVAFPFTVNCFCGNCGLDAWRSTVPVPCMMATLALTSFFSVYIWKKRHGLFTRTGLTMLYSDVREYRHANEQYKQRVDERLCKLQVELAVPFGKKPHTVIMVIGESACRDYMSAFSRQPWENTPWQSRAREDEKHFTFFDNAYSCAMQTVPSLEKALTEKNLYNGKDFATACSIVDIAHKAGYTVHWYSNQGHIGSADTPVTLVAETSDVAKWTKQEIGKAYYDETLIDFMHEIEPKKNNFVVLHLKGSHFNYTNRYTPSYAAACKLTDGDDTQNYRNSIHYTDHIQHSFFDYANRKLNLAAMVYYSDHGAMPDHRRMPYFLGFGMVRIPLWVYLSDEYIDRHQQVADALKENKDKYFTNDLAYELMCGIFDIRSAHYNEEASLASDKYKYGREMLLTDDGRVKLIDEKQ